MDSEILVMKKDDGEVFIFTYTNETRCDVLKQFGRFAIDPNINFTWYDAARLSKAVNDSTPTFDEMQSEVTYEPVNRLAAYDDTPSLPEVEVVKEIPDCFVAFFPNESQPTMFSWANEDEWEVLVWEGLWVLKDQATQVEVETLYDAAEAVYEHEIDNGF